MKIPHYQFREIHLDVHWMPNTSFNLPEQSTKYPRRIVCEQIVVQPHEVVGNGHDFAEHVGGKFGDADVVAEAFGHFALAIEADEDGHGEDSLAGKAVLALDFSVNKEIEFLFGGAEFDVGLEFDGVESGEQGIEQLVDGDGLAFVEALAEILALEQACEPITATEANDVLRGEFAKPIAVAADFGFGGIEDFEDLGEIGLGVGVDLFSGERRAGFGDAGGVANHSGEIADEEDGGVAHVLEVF